MIPEKDLNILIKWSERDENLDLVLKKDAPKEVVKIAKEYHWKPFNVENGVEYFG